MRSSFKSFVVNVGLVRPASAGSFPSPRPLSHKGRGEHNLVRPHSFGFTRSASRWLRRATVAGLRAPTRLGIAKRLETPNASLQT